VREYDSNRTSRIPNDKPLERMRVAAEVLANGTGHRTVKNTYDQKKQSISTKKSL